MRGHEPDERAQRDGTRQPQRSVAGASEQEAAHRVTKAKGGTSEDDRVGGDGLRDQPPNERQGPGMRQPVMRDRSTKDARLPADATEDPYKPGRRPSGPVTGEEGAQPFGRTSNDDVRLHQSRARNTPAAGTPRWASRNTHGLSGDRGHVRCTGDWGSRIGRQAQAAGNIRTGCREDGSKWLAAFCGHLFEPAERLLPIAIQNGPRKRACIRWGRGSPGRITGADELSRGGRAPAGWSLVPFRGAMFGLGRLFEETSEACTRDVAPAAAPGASGWNKSCRVEITPSPLGDASFLRRTRNGGENDFSRHRRWPHGST